ncbi:hypothetical protein, partial [Klebsiella aerogenes]|uniref:hypothetical protein n=1 Tax=Klebsiella aerogenes TaxID=548 RepID=UPI0013D4995E
CFWSSIALAGILGPCEETTCVCVLDDSIDVGSEFNYSGQSTSSVIRLNSPTTTSQIMAR